MLPKNIVWVVFNLFLYLLHTVHSLRLGRSLRSYNNQIQENPHYTNRISDISNNIFNFGRSRRCISLAAASHGSIDSVTLNTANILETISFYHEFLGLPKSSNDSSEKIKITSTCEVIFRPIDSESISNTNGKARPVQGEGFAGLGLSSEYAYDIVDRDRIMGSSDMVVNEISDFGYGASMIPDEDEMKTIPVKFGKVVDPNGNIVEIKKVSQFIFICNLQALTAA